MKFFQLLNPLGLALLMGIFWCQGSFAQTGGEDELSYRDQVQIMYVAYYGRPGDAGGLDFWAGKLEEVNGNLMEIIDSFGNSMEFTERFGDLDDEELVNNIFLQLLGKNADSGGLNFYVNGIREGRFTLASIALNVADGTKEKPEGRDNTVKTNKLRAANAFSKAYVEADAPYGEFQIDDAKLWLGEVDSTEASVTAAMDRLPDLLEMFSGGMPQGLFVFMAVDGTRPTSDGESQGVLGTIDRAWIHVGEEINLSARLRCEDGKVYTAGRFDAPCFTGRDQVAWSVSDPSVATVTLGYSNGFAHHSAGIVRGAGLGQITVTADFKGHSASIPLNVIAETATARQSSKDRPDDTSGPQIHFVYAVPIEASDNGYGRFGEISLIAELMQEWLFAEAEMTWRLDTHEGELDVSILALQWEEDQDLGEIVSTFHNALEEREEGRLNPEKKYAIFFNYDGYFPALGIASGLGGSLAITHISGPLHETIASTGIHEIIHTLGAVPACAPNTTQGGHVDDDRSDIMGGGGYVEGVLDWGRDDYFRHSQPDCLDIADSPYWVIE